MEGHNFGVVKEPRGFIKILQLVLGILAFSITAGFTTTFSFKLVCSDTEEVLITGTVQYPFEIDDISKEYDICENNKFNFRVIGDFSSDSQFFVAVGVLSMLYVIAALVLYTFFNNLYDNNENVPIADFGVHLILSILWLAGSSAWANSLTGLRSATSIDTLLQENESLCHSRNCIDRKEAKYSSLVISIIFGFLNLFVWASNLWFLFKETRYFKERKAGPVDASNNPAGP